MSDLTAGRLSEVAAMAAAGVCAICEEELANGDPVEPGLPYHRECLSEAIAEGGRLVDGCELTLRMEDA